VCSTRPCFVIDPETAFENVIRTAPGPFAMAFDPFTLDGVAKNEQVAFDTRDPGRGLRRYRFAYLASFTQSFVQVIARQRARTARPSSASSSRQAADESKGS
jgi:hypothetical protein